MSPRTVERVDDWETVPFGGGYSGLRDLASQEFSGVVTAGPTRLFMIRGTVVGVLDGSIDDFDGASGTAREAPHPALPLLAVMQERSDEVRAKYYTEDTPIADVDRTLADGSFTGYVELSENVLSGDYYQVYHQGRSMSVAYVGTSERLITDDEAFEQANDEVGIYEVRPVDIEPIDIPEASDDAGATATGATTGEEATGAASAGEDATDAATDETAASETEAVDIPSATSPSESGESDATEPAPGSAATDDGPSEAAEEGGTDPGESGSRPNAAAQADQQDAGTPESDETTTDSDRTATDSSSQSPDESSTASRSTARDDPGPGADEAGAGSNGEAAGDTHPGANVSSSASAGNSRSPQRAGASSESQPTTADADPSPPTGGTDRARADDQASGNASPSQGGPGGQANRSQASASASGAGAADLEVRSIPSLDPARTSTASKPTPKRTQDGRSGGAQSSQSQETQPPQQGQQRSSDQPTRGSSDASPQQSRQDSPSQQSGQARRSTPERQADEAETARSSAASGSDSAEVADELAAREQEIEDLRTDLERVEAERDELETKAAELESERDRLQAELEEAQAEIDRLTERLDDFAAEGEAAGTQLSASEAIDNTNLFVRYRSKGDATLETAHSGNADRSAVEENMRLEYHTQFDADDAAVGNEPFDDFLRGTIQYRFVDWIIRSLLYEVRDTGHADGMADLYNALPKIDRAELNGQVSVSYSEDGEEHRSQERFDVVVRDRMGNPLIVANINNSRDPATDAMMTDLVKRAERVGESSETLAGAFLVTESFFEPEALETAEGATSSGLFSRDKRKSFVNLSRKGGYHLCLVEARNQEFHLAVPEL